MVLSFSCDPLCFGWGVLSLVGAQLCPHFHLATVCTHNAFETESLFLETKLYPAKNGPTWQHWNTESDII